MRPEFTPQDIERFWSRVDRSGGPDACWHWTRGCFTTGYGQFKIHPHPPMGAHRVAFFLTYGHWPEPMGLHTCDNPPCCNPAHIREGGQDRNMQEKWSRGRGKAPRMTGEASGRAKLTEAQVREMRRLFDGNLAGTRELATQFRTPIRTVQNIVHRDSWRHID